MTRKFRKSDEPRMPGADQNLEQEKAPEGDTEGHSLIMDPELSRTLARDREKDIQRNLRSESRRPFFRRGR